MKKLLLDIHVLLWAIGNSAALSLRVTEYLNDYKNEVFISAISLWEIALKHSMGKLELNFAVEDIPKYCQQMGFRLIPLMPLDALGIFKLPLKQHHKDPFDRMLIFQCLRGKFTLLSKDDKMKYYENDGLECIW